MNTTATAANPTEVIIEKRIDKSLMRDRVEILPGNRVIFHTSGMRRREKDFVEEELREKFTRTEDGAFWRFTNRRDEQDLIRSGEFTASRDNSSGAAEAGISVADTATYGIFGYRYGYKLAGEVVGYGADGEPLLKADTIVFLTKPRPTAGIMKRERELDAKHEASLAAKTGWTPEGIRAALMGHFRVAEPANI